MNDDIAPGIKDYIALAIISVITALSGYLTTRHNARFKVLEAYNIEKEKTDREEKDRAVDHCEKCRINIFDAVKNANKELMTTIQEGLKTERVFRIEVMKEQGLNIEKIFGRLDEISILSAEIKSVQDNNIKHQEEICRLRHRDED